MKRLRLTESLGTIDIGKISEKQRSEILEATKKKKKGDEPVNLPVSIFPKIEAIHVGITKNKTFYPAASLKGDFSSKSGVYSWVLPYRKPMLTHHNQYGGEPIGRVKNAIFAKETQAGKEGLMITAEITDSEAIEKVLDGRYFTVSIGAETSSAICSICGVNRVEEWCDHRKGKTYDGKECYWIIGEMWFSELSFVNIPADQDAMVVDLGVTGLNEFTSSENAFLLTESAKEEFEEAINQELTLLSEGVNINDLYNIITTFKSAGMTETEIIERWTEITESAKDNKNPKEEVKQVNFEDLLKQVKAMAEEKLTEFLNKETDDVVELKVKLALSKETIETLTKEITELNTSFDSIKVEKEALEAKGQDHETKVKTLEASVRDAEEENSTLLTENTNLSAQLHKNLAERVVDLKIALGKPGSEDKDKALVDHIDRKPESLQDTLKDLLVELETKPGNVHPGRVNREGLVDDKQKNSKTVDLDIKPVDNKDSGITTEADVFKALLKGNRK